MKSILSKANPAIEKVFAEAGSPKKVMCIPMDYAKKTHVALACNGESMRLKKTFNVHNSPEDHGSADAANLHSLDRPL